MDTLTLNAGNGLFKREKLRDEHIRSGRLAAELILEGNALIGYDAVNVGGYDLSQGIDYLLKRAEEHDIPLVCANLCEQHGQTLFPPSRMLEAGGVKVGVFGLIDPKLKRDKIPSGHKLHVDDPTDTAKTVVEDLRLRGAQFVVLLTDMKGGALRKMARHGPPIDLIIASDKRNQIGLPIIVEGTYITHLDRGGKSIGQLDVTFAPLGGEASHPDARGKWVGPHLFRHNFVQLRLDIPDHPEMAKLVGAAKKEIAKVQKQQLTDTETEERSGCGTKYMGAAVCKKCHADRYALWAKSDHARAMKSLEAKDRQYDEECVVCHSLAFECDEGNVSLQNMEAFANVQCESCHGPSDLHVDSGGEQSMKPLPTLDKTCLKCHTPERSDIEDFRTRFDKMCGQQLLEKR